MGVIAWIVVGAMAGILVNRLTGTGGELLMIVVRHDRRTRRRLRRDERPQRRVR